MVELATLFNRVHSVRVALFGDFMLDLYTFGQVSRVSPEAPVPVLKSDGYKRLPGGAGNVALNLRSLGASVKVFGRIGNDHEGAYLRQLLHEEGIEIEGLIEESNYSTTVKHRLLAGSHQLLRIDTESTPHLSELGLLRVRTFLHHHLDDIDVIAISDYKKGFLTDEMVQEIISWAREHRRPVLVDPKGTDFSQYAGATLIKPNEKEAYEAAGLERSVPIDLVAERLLEITRCQYLVITRSEKGISLFNAFGRRDFPVVCQEVCDVTGAGDTVLATLAFAMGQGFLIEQAISLSNVAAGLAVSHLGCARITMIDIAKHILTSAKRTKIFQEDRLFALSQVMQEQDYALFALSGVHFSPVQWHQRLQNHKQKFPETMRILYLCESSLSDAEIDMLASMDVVDAIILCQHPVDQAADPFAQFVFDQVVQ